MQALPYLSVCVSTLVESPEVQQFIIRTGTEMAQNFYSLLYNNRSSQEKLWLDPIRYYMFLDEKLWILYFCWDFWSQNMCKGMGQPLCASWASLEGAGWAARVETGCLAHSWCDYKSNLWHKLHKVNLWMTIIDKWLFY